jgi:hypothetical protein
MLTLSVEQQGGYFISMSEGASSRNETKEAWSGGWGFGQWLVRLLRTLQALVKDWFSI